MTPSHAVKNGKRYRYYITRDLTTRPREAVPDGRRIPAGDIEQIVVARIRAFLSSATEIHAAVEPNAKSVIEQKSLIARAAALSDQWEQQSPAQTVDCSAPSSPASTSARTKSTSISSRNDSAAFSPVMFLPCLKHQR